MSEKAISIGHYFVASGVYTVFGVTFPIIEETKFHKLLFGGLEEQGLGKWGFSADPYEMAKMMIAHIDKKRKDLGIDKAQGTGAHGYVRPSRYRSRITFNSISIKTKMGLDIEPHF
jgi:hypothetical protein